MAQRLFDEVGVPAGTGAIRGGAHRRRAGHRQRSCGRARAFSVAGPLKMVGPMLTMSDSPLEVKLASPALGEHTDDILMKPWTRRSGDPGAEGQRRHPVNRVMPSDGEGRSRQGPSIVTDMKNGHSEPAGEESGVGGRALACNTRPCRQWNVPTRPRPFGCGLRACPELDEGVTADQCGLAKPVT